MGDMSYLTIAETRSALRISRPTVARLIEAGELVAVKVGDHRTSPFKVHIDSIRAYLNRHTVTGSQS